MLKLVIFLCFLTIVTCSCDESTSSSTDTGTYYLVSNNERIKVYTKGGEELPSERWNESINLEIKYIKAKPLDKIELLNSTIIIYFDKYKIGTTYKKNGDTLLLQESSSTDMLFSPFAIQYSNVLEIDNIAYLFHSISSKHTAAHSSLVYNFDSLEVDINKRVSDFTEKDTLIYYTSKQIYRK